MDAKPVQCMEVFAADMGDDAPIVVREDAATGRRLGFGSRMRGLLRSILPGGAGVGMTEACVA